MDKYQQKFYVGIVGTNICAFLGLKIFSTIHDNQLHIGHYLICGLALTSAFIGGYDIGWHLGSQQHQHKIKELQTRCAALEVKNTPHHTITVSDLNCRPQQQTLEASDSDDSEDYDAVRIKSV